MPLESGGFVGCYCSFEHMRGTVYDNPDTGEIIEPKFNHNRLFIVNEMEKIYVKYGIWDRV